MPLVFVGDTPHRYFQEKQVETLRKRASDLEVHFWSTEGFGIFSDLDRSAEEGRLFLIASRHGAIATVQWVARNPDKVERLVLLHPSLHLNLAGMDAPTPHFVPTTVICHSRVSNPGYEEIAQRAGSFFHDYSIHLTPEPMELTSTLSLLTLGGA